MTPFADEAAYLARWPDPDGELDMEALRECLLDATDLIASELRAAGIDYDAADEDFRATMARVCRTVAHRAMGGGSTSSDIPFGATQLSETADAFSATVHLSNPFGEVYLTEGERRSLGVGGVQAAVLCPYL